MCEGLSALCQYLKNSEDLWLHSVCGGVCRAATDKGAEEEAERQLVVVRKLKAEVTRKEGMLKATQSELDKVTLFPPPPPTPQPPHTHTIYYLHPLLQTMRACMQMPRITRWSFNKRCVGCNSTKL